jgi:hypothetical protein
VIQQEVVPAAVVYRRPNRLDLVAAVLLVATVALHVAAMFPTYFNEPASHQSLASQMDLATLYAILAAAWALVLAIGLSGPARIPISAAMAVGIGATELGFRVADLGDMFRYGYSQAGAGLLLMTVAWVVGAAATVVLVLAARRQARLTANAQPEGHVEPGVGDPAAGSREAWTAGVIILAVVVAGAFFPPWDVYRAVSSTTGRAVTRNLGNAFSNPWQIVTGNVLVACAMLIVPIVAIRLKDRRIGAAAVVGVLLVLATQLVSAVVQVDIPVSADQLGINPSQAAQLGLSLSLHLSGWFVLESVAAFGLFAAVMVWATLRVDHENSPGTLPSAPEARSDAISWPS